MTFREIGERVRRHPATRARRSLHAINVGLRDLPVARSHDVIPAAPGIHGARRLARDVLLRSARVEPRPGESFGDHRGDSVASWSASTGNRSSGFVMFSARAMRTIDVYRTPSRSPFSRRE